MARYVDADKAKELIKEYSEKLSPLSNVCKKSFIVSVNAIDLTPTADVVPESEVERLKRILNSYALQYGTVKDQKKVIDQAKTEVAREIFEEIEKIATAEGAYDYVSIQEIAELKKKYT